MTEPRYDRIGAGYATTRREDPRQLAQIEAALGDARSVVNVGAGAGSYEPRDRHVIADRAERRHGGPAPPDRVPAIRAFAHDLPLRDDAVEAAMAILSVHHWDEHAEAGVRELRRVSSRARGDPDRRPRGRRPACG